MINWIDISYKLPDSNRDVLVSKQGVKYGILAAFYHNHSWFDSRLVQDVHEITHWAELSDINLPE